MPRLINLDTVDRQLHTQPRLRQIAASRTLHALRIGSTAAARSLTGIALAILEVVAVGAGQAFRDVAVAVQAVIQVAFGAG
jgi:hypothetical protein